MKLIDYQHLESLATKRGAILVQAADLLAWRNEAADVLAWARRADRILQQAMDHIHAESELYPAMMRLYEDAPDVVRDEQL